MLQRVVQAIVKRIPAHGADRAQEALLPLRDFERLAVPSPSALSVICDDGEKKDLDIVEVLDAAGVKGTFAVSPDLVGRPGFLTYDELRAIHAAGHEIAFHGNTHDAFTSFRDTEALVQACTQGVERLRAEGLGQAQTLVYPFGRNNRAVREGVSRVFNCAFTTWFGLNERSANRYAIRRIAYGAYTGKQPSTLDWYRGVVDRCATAPCWPALMLHPGSPEHTAAHTAELKQLIAHAQDRGLSVRAVKDHLRGQAAPMSPAATEHDAHARHAHD